MTAARSRPTTLGVCNRLLSEVVRERAYPVAYTATGWLTQLGCIPGRPGDDSLGAIRFGKAPWKTGQPSIFQQHPPVRHRGRDARYDAATLSDDAFAVRVFFWAIRTRGPLAI